MMPRSSTAPYAESNPRRGNAGFLLVETLATMTISAFILVALLSVVSLMLRASDRTGSTSQKVESTSRVLAALKREVEQIVPIRWAGKDGGFVFSGTDRSLLFAREVTLPDGSVDERAVFLQGDGNQLSRREATLPPTSRGFAELTTGDAQDMLQGRFGVRFAYFSPLDDGQEALTDNWQTADQLPVAIRISLTDSKGAPLGSTRIPILVDAETGCAAPGKGLCNFIGRTATADDQQPDDAKPVDPDDSQGWAGYAK